MRETKQVIGKNRRRKEKLNFWKMRRIKANKGNKGMEGKIIRRRGG